MLFTNVWYVAEFSDNVRQKPTGVRMLGRDFVLFRDPEEREVGLSIAKARERLRKQTAAIPGQGQQLDVKVDPPPESTEAGGGGGLLGGGGNRETVRVSGPEGDSLGDLATRFREALERDRNR